MIRCDRMSLMRNDRNMMYWVIGICKYKIQSVAFSMCGLGDELCETVFKSKITKGLCEG